MINTILRNIIRFIVLVLVQVLVIKNIELGIFINPFIYVLFILLLPFETPKWMLLLIGLFLGLTIDMFYDTIGMHATACVFMSFLRPSVLNWFSPREGYEYGMHPTIQYLGIPWFLSYSAILVFSHHLILFFVEIFRFSETPSTLLRVLISSLFTLLLIVVSQFLFNRKKEEE